MIALIAEKDIEFGHVASPLEYATLLFTWIRLPAAAVAASTPAARQSVNLNEFELLHDCVYFFGFAATNRSFATFDTVTITMPSFSCVYRICYNVTSS